LRAYAALAIILFHLVVSGGAKLPDTFSFISTHFGFGVPLFFVVSGFSLAYGYWGRFNGEESLGHYFTRRFTRIAPLFYTMLVFQLVYLWLCWDVVFSPSDVLINALFAFNVVPKLTDGIVGASWTIGVEMIFYAMFPLLLMLCKTTLRAVFVLSFSILISTVFTIGLKPFEAQIQSFIHHNFITNLPYFLWGILGFHLHRKISAAPVAAHRYICWGLCVLAIMVVLTLYRSAPIYMFFWTKGMRTTWDMLWGFPFVVLCIAMAMHPSRIISNPVTRYLGKISFSLYLVHPTIVYGLGHMGVYTWVYTFFPTSWTAGYVASVVIAMALITSISLITFKYIEQPGMEWGKRLSRKKPLAVASA